MNKSKKNYYIIFLCIIIIVSIFMILLLHYKNNTCFKTENRVNNIKKFKNNNKDLDTVGWLRVAGTNIDYPIIYSNDVKVLNRVEDNFLWQVEKSKDLSKREVIFGHNIINVSNHPRLNDSRLSRFEQLMSFIYYDFAKDNQFIQLTKNNKNYLYQIFSVELINDFDFLYKGSSIKDKDYKKYIKDSINNSFYKYDIDVNSDDNIITLVTCTRFYGPISSYRFKVDAKLINNRNGIKNKKVLKNDNYKYIENILYEEEVNDENI